MRRAAVMMLIVMLGLGPAAAAASDATESQKSKDSKGLTVEDVGRGLKSAGQSIEKEIPKIGSAIGKMFKKVTGKDAKKESSQDSKKK